jgi:integrase
MTREDGKTWYGELFHATVWNGAFKTAGLPRRRKIDGEHALRHFYASTALAGGVSIRELAEYLGHEDAATTLRIYAHMMPSSHHRARQAVDAVFGATGKRQTAYERPGDAEDSVFGPRITCAAAVDLD